MLPSNCENSESDYTLRAIRMGIFPPFECFFYTQQYSQTKFINLNYQIWQLPASTLTSKKNLNLLK